MLHRSGRQSLAVHSDGVVYEELDPHGCESHGGWAARAVRRRLVGEEEPGAVNCKAGNDVPAIEMPQELGAECGLVEIDRSVAVADGQHGRNLSSHRPPLKTNVERRRAASWFDTASRAGLEVQLAMRCLRRRVSRRLLRALGQTR